MGKRAKEGDFDMLDSLIDHEEGRLSEPETVRLFQRLIDTGLAWKLQGHYGRTAQALIEAGRCKRARGITSGEPPARRSEEESCAR